ncbi:MAG: hypothetical protein MI861_14190, partial [Pirellulales bacterium]|nr:hypothetical protein [Pirellulales bacterium]
MSRFVFLLLPLVVSLPRAFAAEEALFAEVAQIFGRHCVQCHNEVDQEGDFSLQTATSVRASGFV